MSNNFIAFIIIVDELEKFTKMEIFINYGEERNCCIMIFQDFHIK